MSEVPHDRLPHILKAAQQSPCWAVVDYGDEPEPAARIVAMFYHQDEASEYAHWRRKTKYAQVAG